MNKPPTAAATVNASAVTHGTRDRRALSTSSRHRVDHDSTTRRKYVSRSSCSTTSRVGGQPAATSTVATVVRFRDRAVIGQNDAVRLGPDRTEPCRGQRAFSRRMVTGRHAQPLTQMAGEVARAEFADELPAVDDADAGGQPRDLGSGCGWTAPRVTPCSWLSSCSRSRISATPAGSRPFAGSSRISSSGWCSSALARPSRCALPSDNVPRPLARVRGQPQPLDDLVHLMSAHQATQTSGNRKVLPDRELRIRRRAFPPGIRPATTGRGRLAVPACPVRRRSRCWDAPCRAACGSSWSCPRR